MGVTHEHIFNCISNMSLGSHWSNCEAAALHDQLAPHGFNHANVWPETFECVLRALVKLLSVNS